MCCLGKVLQVTLTSASFCKVLLLLWILCVALTDTVVCAVCLDTCATEAYAVC
jgi:hypothetical protein